MVDEAPRILAGRYEVGELIGRGGMAEVHIGHDNRLGRTVAIKILRSDLARDPSFQARFRREAQSAAALNHPAIVAVYDTGEDTFTEPSGAVSHVPFIVMEYVEGHTVRDILQDGNAVPIDEAVEITAGVLSALEYSHHAGIVHRDIKPANVMLTPTGAIKVMDFGIARALADSAATMTQTQAVIGTAQYLSPEQARGESVDARSDLYSTGCLLFELLTGRPPFTGDSPVSVAYQHVRETPVTPSSIASDVPESLDRVTLKALAKERTARYGSAAEFRADLEAALRGSAISAGALGVVAAAAGAAAAGATEIISAVPAEAPTQVAPAWAPVAASTAVEVDPDDPLAELGDEEDEKPRNQALLWTLITVAVLAIAAIVTMLVLNGSNDEKEQVVTISVPDMTGMTLAEVQAKLKEVGFTKAPKVTNEASTDIPAGIFTRSDPAANAKAEKDAVISVWISQGADSVNVPDVANFTQAQAKDSLTRAGLQVGITRSENSGTVPRDSVIGTDPAANTPVDQGSTIVLIISSGMVEVPDLTGKTSAEAKDILNTLGLTPTLIQTESEDKPVDTVLSQDKSGLVNQRSSITLEIAIAPTQVEVPTNLVNMTENDAIQTLLVLGLAANPQPGTANTLEKGRVEAVLPSGGTKVNANTSVVIYISTGANYQDGSPTQSPSPSTTPPAKNGNQD